jgi:hypothetical protein
LNVLFHCTDSVHTEMGMNMAIGENIYNHLRTGEKGINRQGRIPGSGGGKYLRG